MDVLDLHWYPEAQGGGVRITANNNSTEVAAARVQAARSLWDPNYIEDSWIAQWMTQGPINLLSRVQRDIDDFKPGTRIAITEYNYGGTNHISGAIAQADALGVFAREQVFAANMWNLHGDSQSQFASAAFNMYLDYDGTGGRFGDTIVAAETDTIEDSAIYASIDADNPEHMVLVAINRTDQPLDTAIAITSDYRFDSADVFQLTGAAATPVNAGDIVIDLLNAFHYQMPAFSVSTLVLHAARDSADFNQNGHVDGADFLAWQRGAGILAGAELAQGDGNGDGTVDMADLAIWQNQFGTSSNANALQIPEPSTCKLFLALILMVLQRVGPSTHQ
jgi:Dockerin type I domain